MKKLIPILIIFGILLMAGCNPGTESFGLTTDNFDQRCNAALQRFGVTATEQSGHYVTLTFSKDMAPTYQRRISDEISVVGVLADNDTDIVSLAVFGLDDNESMMLGRKIGICMVEPTITDIDLMEILSAPDDKYVHNGFEYFRAMPTIYNIRKAPQQ